MRQSEQQINGENEQLTLSQAVHGSSTAVRTAATRVQQATSSQQRRAQPPKRRRICHSSSPTPSIGLAMLPGAQRQGRRRGRDGEGGGRGGGRGGDGGDEAAERKEGRGGGGQRRGTGREEIGHIFTGEGGAAQSRARYSPPQSCARCCSPLFSPETRADTLQRWTHG